MRKPMLEKEQKALKAEFKSTSGLLMEQMDEGTSADEIINSLRKKRFVKLLNKERA
jgi:hypothetical protein